MYYVRQMFLLLSLTSVLFLFFGLVKPWLLLWWEDTQNRRKVLKVYGTVAVVFYLIYLGLGLYQSCSKRNKFFLYTRKTNYVFLPSIRKF
jgi:hypothetical protein